MSTAGLRTPFYGIKDRTRPYHAHPRGSCIKPLQCGNIICHKLKLFKKNCSTMWLYVFEIIFICQICLTFCFFLVIWETKHPLHSLQLAVSPVAWLLWLWNHRTHNPVFWYSKYDIKSWCWNQWPIPVQIEILVYMIYMIRWDSLISRQCCVIGIKKRMHT